MVLHKKPWFYCLTQTDVRFHDHADVIGTVTYSRSGWIVFAGLDQVYDLQCQSSLNPPVPCV